MTARTATDKYRKATRESIRKILGRDEPYEVKNPQTGEIIKANILDVENKIYSVVPSARLANYKYGSAVANLLFNDCRGDGYADFNTRKANDLNDIIKIIASAHEDEYDETLNGLGVDELLERFGENYDDTVNDEAAEIAKLNLSGASDYEIVRIKTFEEAKAYHDYTNPNSRWCLTYMDNMFGSYSAGGMNAIYFAFVKDYKDVKCEFKGNDTPLDDYGKSLMSIIVRPNGGLAFCTCRWNHEHGGDDQVLDAIGVSKLINKNFFDVFKPITPDELKAIIGKHYTETKPNDECKANGWKMLKNNKTGNFAYYDEEAGRIVRDNIRILIDGSTLYGAERRWNLILPNGEKAFDGTIDIYDFRWCFDNALPNEFAISGGLYNKSSKNVTKTDKYAKIGTYYKDGDKEGLVVEVNDNGEPTKIMSLKDGKDITFNEAQSLEKDGWKLPTKDEWESFRMVFPLFQVNCKKEGKGEPLSPVWLWSGSRFVSDFHWFLCGNDGNFLYLWGCYRNRVRLFCAVSPRS